MPSNPISPPFRRAIAGLDGEREEVPRRWIATLLQGTDDPLPFKLAVARFRRLERDSMFVAVVVTVVPIMTMIAVMPTVVVAVTFIVNGMVMPIRMISFPVMEPRQAEGFANDPNIARSQIVIAAANDTHILETVPDVIIRRDRHLYGYRRWRRRPRCFNRHAAIRLNDAARHQGQSR